MKKAIQVLVCLLLVAALAIPASAAAMTPSVEQKGAPTVAVEGTAKEVTVTAVADVEEAPAEVKEAIEEAYKSIETAGSLEKAAPALTETLKAMDSKVDVKDLVVRDLFHVDVKLEKDEKVTLKFDLKVEKNALVIPMLFIDGEWVPVDPELVTVNADGTVSVDFVGEIGTIAFVVEKSE